MKATVRFASARSPKRALPGPLARRISRHQSGQRSGHLAAEALLIVPILLIISIGIIEFGLLLSLQQSAAHAAIQGVREAAKGASLAEVAAVVEGSLGGFNVKLSKNAAVLIEDDGGAQKEGVLDCPATDGPSSGKIRVTVCVNSTGSPVSGLIAKFGATDLLDKILTKSAVAQKE